MVRIISGVIVMLIFSAVSMAASIHKKGSIKSD
jgi:hypothetical protein